MPLEQIIALLRRGASADIWYDAEDHGDWVNAELIDKVQQAMEQAADVIEHKLLGE